MFVRRAVVAVGLSVSLVGVGMGTAAAATDGGSLLDDPSGPLDSVTKKATDTLSSVTGGGSDSSKSRQGDTDKSGGQDSSASHHSNSGEASKTSSSSAGGGGSPVAELQKQTRDVPSTGKGPLVDEQGLCADGSPAGHADSCESDTLDNGYLNACIRKNDGIVSQVGNQTGLREQAGLSCPEGTEEMPPPGGGEHNPPSPPESEPAPMPPPLHRANPAEPAEPIVAEPSFTG